MDKQLVKKTAFEVGVWLESEGFSEDVVAAFAGKLEQKLETFKVVK